MLMHPFNSIQDQLEGGIAEAENYTIYFQFYPRSTCGKPQSSQGIPYVTFQFYPRSTEVREGPDQGRHEVFQFYPRSTRDFC